MATAKWGLSYVRCGRRVEKIPFDFEQPSDVVIYLDKVRLRSRPIVASDVNVQQWISRVQNGRCMLLNNPRFGYEDVYEGYEEENVGADDTKYCLHAEIDPDVDANGKEEADRKVYLPLSILECASSLDLISSSFIKYYCADISEYIHDDNGDNGIADDEVQVVGEHASNPQCSSLNIALITYLDEKSIKSFYRAREQQLSKQTAGPRVLPTYRYLCECMSRDPDFKSKASKYVMSRNAPAEIEQLLSFVCDYRRNIPSAEIGCGFVEPEDLVLDDLKLTLHPYQKRAVCWMVARERACNEDSSDVEMKKFVDPKFCTATTPYGDDVIFSFYDGSIEKLENLSSMPEIVDTIRGGILADEMGLGKTIEILTCIMNDPVLLQRRKNREQRNSALKTPSKRTNDKLNDPDDDDDAVRQQSSSAKRLRTEQHSFFEDDAAAVDTDKSVACVNERNLTGNETAVAKVDENSSKWVRRSMRPYREKPTVAGESETTAASATTSRSKSPSRTRRRSVSPLVDDRVQAVQDRRGRRPAYRSKRGGGRNRTAAARRAATTARNARNNINASDDDGDDAVRSDAGCDEASEQNSNIDESVVRSSKASTPAAAAVSDKKPRKSRLIVNEEEDEPKIIEQQPNSEAEQPTTTQSSRKEPMRARRQTRAAAIELQKNAVLNTVGAMHADERNRRTLEVLSSTDGTQSSRMRALKKLQEELLQSYSCAQYAAVAAEKKARRSIERINVECICGSDDPTNIVQCATCRVWQHRACTGFYLDFNNKSADSTYHCPQCYQDCENVETHATLIVVPRALLQQWFDEISKCIKSSALSIFIYNGTVVKKKGPKIRNLVRTKSINDSHAHANVTAEVGAPPMTAAAAAAAEPKGSLLHVVYTHPLVIAQHDIVITSYEILRDELQFVDLPDMRSKLRHPKRYNNACSPLTGIRFRRLVFDEAQLVEQSTSKLCAMAMRLRTQFVWAITGTPIIESFENLYGLFRLLGEKSLCDALQFKMSLIIPYGMLRNARPLQTSLAHVMYRQTQQSVREELNLPHLYRHVHMLELDPIERAFYAVRQTNVKNTVRSHAAGLGSEQTLGQLESDTHAQLLEDVNALRLICLHPLLAGVTRGGRFNMPGITGSALSNPASFAAHEGRAHRKRAISAEKSKSVGLRASLLKLIALAKTDVLDEQRKVLMTLNALAGVSWCDADFKTAAEFYRTAMKEWVDLEPIGIEADRLQRIHTLANLNELLQLHDGDGSIGRTLSDDTLHAQVEQLKAEHIKKLTLALQCANEKLAVARVSGHVAALTNAEKSSEAIHWIVDLIRSDLPNDKNTQNLLVSGLTGCLMDQGFQRKFVSTHDAMGFFVDEWKILVEARADAARMVEKLQKAELLTSEFAQRAYFCHLAPRSTFSRQVKAKLQADEAKAANKKAGNASDAAPSKDAEQQERCDICKCTMALTKYELMLYRSSMNIRANRKWDIAPDGVRIGPRAQHSKTSALAADWLATGVDDDAVESDLLGDAHKMVADSMVGRKAQAFETALTWLYTRGKNFYAEHFPKSSSSGGESASPFGDDAFGSRYAHLPTPQLTPKMFSNVLGREFWLMRVVMRTVQDRLSAFDEAGRQALLRIQLKPDENASPEQAKTKKGANKRKPTQREYQELHPTTKNEEEARLLIARSAIPTYQAKYNSELVAARAAQHKKLSKYKFVVSLRQRMKKPAKVAGGENDADEEKDDEDPLARDILKDEKCPVCWEPLVKLPAYSFLPCAHFICDDDLEQLVRVNQGWLQCPQCREKCQPDSIVHVDNRQNAMPLPPKLPTIAPNSTSIPPESNSEQAVAPKKAPKVRFADDSNNFLTGLTAAVDSALCCMPSTSAAAIAADKAASDASAVPENDADRCLPNEFDSFDDSNEEVQGDLSSKIAAIVKCLRHIKRRDPEAACLVFSGFPVAMKMLKTACQENAINAASVQAPSEVSRMLDRLKGRQIDALILSYNACSRGLNITEANHILLLEPVLNKADELQAIGRAYRIGQTRNVHVHYFITRNTIEDRLHTALRDVETFSVPQSSVANLTIGMINSMVGFTANSPAAPLSATVERSTLSDDRSINREEVADEAEEMMTAMPRSRRRTTAFAGVGHRLGGGD